MPIIQEAVAFSSGANFIPNRMRFRLPAQKNDTSIYLLTDSYEYDIELIKNLPSPKNDYKKLIIPYRIIDKLVYKPFRYLSNQNEYNKKILYLNTIKMFPKLIPLRFPYPKTISDNIYISLSELFKSVNEYIRNLPRKYMQEHIFDLFMKVINYFNFSSQKVIVIDVNRVKIYKNPTLDGYNSDLLNALMTAYYFLPEEKIKRIPVTLLFKTKEFDFKFDLRMWSSRDIQKFRRMLSMIGVDKEMSASTNEEAGDSIDSFEVNDEVNDTDDNIENDEIKDSDIEDDVVGIDNDKVGDDEIEQIQLNNQSTTKSILSSINELKTKYNKTENVSNKRDDLYDAKVLDIMTKLNNKINPSIGDNKISTYKTLSSELKQRNDTPIENKLIDDAAKNISKNKTLSNTVDVLNTTTSPREQKIREQVGQIKLNNISFKTLTSITDTPLPKSITPLKLTTTNPGALKGSSFAHISREYEEKLMNNDIAAVLTNLSKLPNGFYVSNVEVEDISNIVSLIDNWKVTLKNKNNDKQQIINIRIPKVKNGRFFYNGTTYNIGKQDFPIPILKIDRKTVICTSNYNKITVTRYDTRSLVDLSMFVKLLNNLSKRNGKNEYIKVGSSSILNGTYVSTIEYDEYASRWLSFINDNQHLEIYFSRQECLRRYSFVSVQPNEFCCGSLNKVPIVLNTDTGLTRDGLTLTDIMLSSLPIELKNEYNRMKPGKMAMYSEIKIGVKIPLGVAVSAWEGLTSLLKKSNAQYQFVDKSFSDSKYFIIPFKDKNLAIQNTISNQLLFNGFYRVNTKSYNVNDFDSIIMNSNSVYVDIFNQLFFKQYTQLTTFITYYNFFMDPMTYNVCEHYNLPTDIVSILIYSSNLLADNNYTSENNASLYRIRSSEIIPAMIHYHLAFAISKFNNTVGSRSRDNKLTWNPNCILKELIDTPTVSSSSALNPFVELHENENITKKGFRGVNNDRAYSLSKRSYDDTMIGKMAISSPNNNNIGINRQLTINPKIDSVRGYTSTLNSNDTEMDDLQLASFSELLTPCSATRDDAIRTAIATSQTSHIVSTFESSPALISNGVDEIVPAYLTDEFSVLAKQDGVVLEINDGYMIVQYKDKTKQAINISNKYAFNSGSGFYVNNKLVSNFNSGDTFKQNDILAYHEKFFHKDPYSGTIRLNIGPLAKVAFTGTYSTYEDAGIMTQKMSKRLTSSITMMKQYKLNASDDIESIVQPGTKVEIGDPLIVFGLGNTSDKSVDNFLKAFQTKNTDLSNNMKKVIRCKDAGTVVDVRMYTIKSMDKLSPSLFEILNNYFKSNIKKRRILDKYDKSNSVYKMDTFYNLPTGPLKTPSIKGITCDVLIEIYIEHEDSMSVGDKAVAYACMKQICSEVIQEGLEPYSEDNPDEEISMFVSGFSILKRMVPSAMITAGANKCLIEMKKHIKKIWES